MARILQEQLLLIGDDDRQMYAAASQALPGAQIMTVHTVFDGIAELAAGHFTTVLAAIEPVARRAQAAVQALRSIAGPARLLLFGSPTLEPVSRQMLEYGCDDYLINPSTPQELQRILGSISLHLADEGQTDQPVHVARATPPDPASLLVADVSDLMLDAQLQYPSDAPAGAVQLLNEQLGSDMRLELVAPDKPAPQSTDDSVLLSHPIHHETESLGILYLHLTHDADQTIPRRFLDQLAEPLAKLILLQQRHSALQKLAITDELTGLYNGRYFRHFLSRIVEKARALRFPVTLLMFDIDNFKNYNDTYGHVIGDEILRQTGSVIKRCCRDHDLVARVSGDEFAVVFWEKEGPRQPRQSTSTPVSRVPHNIMQILDRFKRNLSSQEYPFLGPQGHGSLTISGGLAVYPYDASNVPELINAADQALMFGAKRSGKNSIFLVGGQENPTPNPL
ncbi:MAG: GGDEF domain-containing protein [Phycisphaerales bacterium]|nr:GGDEF domain-containing protein [Phycisphaerales bacterium]